MEGFTSQMELDYASAARLIQSLGERPYRGEQLVRALMSGKRAAQAQTLPAALRQKVEEALPYGGARMLERRVSDKDGTRKYLFEMDDGEYVESVLLPYEYGNTLCVSTQVGCRMGCSFCASTGDGLIRSLTHGEMLAEVVLANADAGDCTKRNINNIVLMGSGEPLDNYEEVMAFIRRLGSSETFNISPRNISLSTCGIIPGIMRLIDEKLPLTLCISMHETDDARRSALMPINKAYPIGEVIEAAKLYAQKSGRRVIAEYALIPGVNDKTEDIERIARMLGDSNFHVNVIPLNSTEAGKHNSCSGSEAVAFAQRLTQAGVSATRRRTMGEDIEGACGQLRARRKRSQSGEVS